MNGLWTASQIVCVFNFHAFALEKERKQEWELRRKSKWSGGIGESMFRLASRNSQRIVSCPDPYDTIHRIPNVFIVEGLVLECKKTLDEQIYSK